MLWIKRIFCGSIALFLITLGVLIANDNHLVWWFVGGAIIISGIILAHITVKRSLPSYSFWMTIIALALAFALFAQNSSFFSYKNTLDGERVTAQAETLSHAVQIKKKRAKKKTKRIDLSSYPKISGSAEVIHAHVFYIGNRYIKLYGVDAPDNDQLCSDANGSSYNCGEMAASWVRNWIDQNRIDCYILKVDPKGRDLATCLWGEYDIGAGLVGAGWGLANTRETSIYKPYEAKAQLESSGLWQGTFYTPEDWRDIKSRRNDFTIKHQTISTGKGFLNFGSWFK
ncbi:MAG: thermonuclease family protein [Alphaproteobacteria bacterium]|nr:thermonuclease family protein [Alphaproteobacteria bacterium]